MDSPYYDWETHHALYNSLNMLHANISSMDTNHNNFAWLCMEREQHIEVSNWKYD